MTLKLLGRYKAGLILGFLFGTIGLFLLTFLALTVPYADAILSPLYAPGRFVAGVLTGGGDGTDALVAVLYLFNGLLYAVVGAMIQRLARK
jgi:hypothetical protein